MELTSLPLAIPHTLLKTYRKSASNESPSFLQSHAFALSISLKIQYQQGGVIRCGAVQQEIGLEHSICSGAEVIYAPKQPQIDRSLAICAVLRIGVMRAL